MQVARPQGTPSLGISYIHVLEHAAQNALIYVFVLQVAGTWQARWGRMHAMYCARENAVYNISTYGGSSTIFTP